MSVAAPGDALLGAEGVRAARGGAARGGLRGGRDAREARVGALVDDEQQQLRGRGRGAASRWEEIKFGQVASLCLQRNRKAFLNEALKGKLSAAEELTGNRHPDDAARVAARAHLRECIASRKGVKGKELGPHEIAKKCMQGRQALSTLESDLMNAQWASLRDGVREALTQAREASEARVMEVAAPGASLDDLRALKAALSKSVDLGRLVPLVDVSGSMTGQPMEAAIGLGLLVSELTHPAFRDRAITFESDPKWVDLSASRGVLEKVRTLQGASWGGSTNFAAACELILEGCVRGKLTPDEVPDLIVFSDMQFDQAQAGYGYGSRGVGARWETHFERLQRRFAEAGQAICGRPYAAPRIIFWNLVASVGFPAAGDTPNCMLLAGFSPSLLKLVLTGAELVAEEKVVTLADGTTKIVKEGPTPAETVRKALDDPNFDPVRVALAGVAEGRLAAYSFVPAATEPEAEASEQVAKKAKVEEEEAFEVVAAA